MPRIIEPLPMHLKYVEKIVDLTECLRESVLKFGLLRRLRSRIMDGPAEAVRTIRRFLCARRQKGKTVAWPVAGSTDALFLANARRPALIVANRIDRIRIG